MVKSILSFAALAALAASASAQLIHYSAPITGSTWTAGKTATVSWTNSCSSVVGNTTFPITLNYQEGLYQVEVPNIGPIGSLNCARSGSTTVTIPATVPQGSTYSILVVNGGNQSYSAQFTISSTVPPISGIPLPTTATLPATTAVLPTTTTTTTTTVSLPTQTNAGSISKVAGSSVALVVVAAVASLLL